jgi:hypothetical protein
VRSRSTWIGTSTSSARKPTTDLGFRGGGESVAVEIELPAGSHVRGEGAVVALHCTGRLGECRFKTGAGDIHLGQTGPLQIKTAPGDISVEQAAGDAEVTTASGGVRIDQLDATERPAAGEDAVEVRARSAFGDITIYRAPSSRQSGDDDQRAEIA